MKHEEHAKRLPASRFYWTVLDPPPSPATNESLRYAFEPVVPAPIDTVECRFVRPGRGGPVIACGIDIEGLGHEHPGMMAVRPDALPDFVRLATELSELNCDGVLDRLAYAAADKRPGVRLLVNRTALLLSVFIMCTSLLCAGLLRRADRFDTTAMDTHAAIASVAAATLGEPRGAEASLPPLVRLQTESRRLSRTRSEGNPDSISVARDIAPDLISLLTAWPQDFPTRAEQIDIRGDIVTIRGAVRDTEDFERLKLALGAEMAGFEPPTGSANKAREGYTFNLVMRALPRSPSPASPLADRGTL